MILTQGALLLVLSNLISGEPLNPKAVAKAGAIIAEGTADYVVDLLCGCGCRYYDVKTCVSATRQVCKDVIKTKCKTKENVECKDEYKEECKTIYKAPTYDSPAYHGEECTKVPEEVCSYKEEQKCKKVPEKKCHTKKVPKCLTIP